MFEGGRQPTAIQLGTTGGLNLALQPEDIAENELSIAYNFYYDPATGKFTTRPGTRIEETTGLTTDIDITHSFVRSDGEGYLIAVSDSKLYYLNASDVWTHIVDLASELPTMISFNGFLLVADGSPSGILQWDGTTQTRVAGSPQCTVIYEQGNRVVTNNTSGRAELDAVYFSGPEDQTDWNTTTGGALIVRAGYGDGQAVNAFSTIGDILLVSKVASVDGKVSKKKFYGIDMSGAASSWSARDISKENAAIGPYAISGMGQDVLYVDTQGVESLRPTQDYGDVANDPVIGAKINQDATNLANSSDFVKVLTIKNISTTFFLFGTTRIYAFSHLTRAFTEIVFEQDILHITQHGDKTYLAGANGKLYSFTEDGGDEATEGTITDFVSVSQFKMITGTGDLLLTRVHSNLDYIKSGTYDVRVSSGEFKEKTLLQSVDFNIASGDDDLHEATYDLSEGTFDLGSVGTNRRISCRAKYRGDGILLQIQTKNYARISIGGVKPLITQVGR